MLVHLTFIYTLGLLIYSLRNYLNIARCGGSDGSMSASGSAGSIPGGLINFHLKIFNLGARRDGDVHFLIARLYITGLD